MFAAYSDHNKEATVSDMATSVHGPSGLVAQLRVALAMPERWLSSAFTT